LRRLGLDRVRPFLAVFLAVGFAVLIGVRERQQSGIRRTRTVLLNTRVAIDAYMAENEGKCPPSLADLKGNGSFKSDGRDAWGHPLSFVCPAPSGDLRYLLSSDGADGLPAGLDRIE
jgi:general secretion pathway protein G